MNSFSSKIGSEAQRLIGSIFNAGGATPLGGAWRFNLKITGILLVGFLLLWASGGQALVSPEHYEKLKMQNKQKTKETEKIQPQVPVKIQVHRPGEGRPPAGKDGPK
jgi:hypothetical protein